MKTDTQVLHTSFREETTPRRSSKRSPVPFLIVWVLLIVAGSIGAWLYSVHMKEQITAQIQAQTGEQISQLASSYEKRLQELDKNYSEQITVLENKVQSLNELLTFAKDNASSATDNSNKLYTQLAQVQKQLDELKRFGNVEMTNVSVQRVNRFFFLTIAPFAGIMIWLLAANFTIELPSIELPISQQSDKPASTITAPILTRISTAEETASLAMTSIRKQSAQYEQTNITITGIAHAAAAQVAKTGIIYNRRITLKLGDPVKSVQSNNLTAQLYTIHAQNFTAYAMKVKLKTNDAMKLVLGKDENGRAETTLSAVQRYNAFAGINAGGFADGDGKRYPLSTTVLDGKYVNGFEPSFADLFFVGLNQDRKLIGGKYASKDELDNAQPQFGVSFVPVLLKNGVMTPIPLKWQSSPLRAPRTVIANYKDDQLLFLVADGRNENGSGATLKEMQILVERFGAVDAYNLDGGGSTTLIFDGKVINHPSDGQLRPLATNFLFFE